MISQVSLCSCDHSLNLVVEDKNESTTGSSEDVRKASLEEGSSTFVMVDLLEAINGSVIHGVGSSLSGVHHESSSNGIEWVRDDTSSDGDDLGESPHGEEVGLLDIFEQNDLTSIEHTEVGGSIGDDTNDGDTETVVETTDTLGGRLLEAIDQSSEFSLFSRTDISGKSGSCEIERVHDGKGGSTGGTTRGAVTNEEHTRLGLWVVWAEPLLVEIFTGEVQGLGWEVTNDVGQVSSPERSETLLGDDSLEAVSNTIISLISWDVLVSILDLEQKLDSLDWGDGSLGDGGGNTTDHEIDEEVLLLCWLFICGHTLLSICSIVKTNWNIFSARL